MSPGLHLRGVTIAVAGRILIDALDCAVAPGEIVTVMGPSGSGKSTLFDSIGGCLGRAFTATGSIGLNGRDVSRLPAERRRVGVLFQDDLLFPHLTVGDNLAFGLAAAVKGRAARRHRVETSLAAAGLPGFAPRSPATLSGGQRARVALLRTLLAEPEAVLLDEPFGALDADRRAAFRDYVFTQTRARGLPVLLATHDEADAIAAGGRVVKLG